MSKKNKATGSVANAEQLNIAQKIIQNYEDDNNFSKTVSLFLRDRLPFSSVITACKTTPNVLALGGANLDLELIMNPTTILKCFRMGNSYVHGHNLSEGILNHLLFELRNPVMLLKGSQEGTLVVVTDLKDDCNRQIIISVALNRRSTHHLANQITSAYGRENFDGYLRRQINNGNLIAINKNKANQMFQSAGLQLPIEETTISFDNSIAYTMENVKGFSLENLNNFNKIGKLGVPDAEEFSSSIEKIKELISSFDETISFNEELVDMIRFFEYAGELIYDSRLWHEFQCDKEYLEDNEAASRLSGLLKNAQELVRKLEVELNALDRVKSDNSIEK